MISSGEIINGQYEILKFLASGAMGDVFLVENKFSQKTSKKQILKILRPEFSKDKKLMERFHNEMIAGLLVDHPNLARTYDFVQTKYFSGYTMDYIPGEEFADLMSRHGAFDVHEALGYLKQIAQGSKALHDNGIIHRDLKPENILLDEDGVVKIVDFGISVLDINSRQTDAGSLLGSAVYIAPEYISEGAVSEQIDIYALGVIAYELLTGELPYPDGNVVQLMEYKISTPPIPLTERKIELPELINDFVIKMINPIPEKRFKDCQEIIDRIDRIREMTFDEMDEFYENNRDTFFNFSFEDHVSSKNKYSNKLSFASLKNKVKEKVVKSKSEEKDQEGPLLSEEIRTMVFEKWKKAQDK